MSAGPPAAGAGPARTRWGPVVALGLAMFVVTSEITIAAVALPGIGVDLGAGPTATAWVLLGYTLPMAALAIPAGRWGDTADSRPVFLAAQAGILAATVVTVLAPTLAVLVAARLLQGVAAAFVIAVYLPIVTAAVRPEQRGRAMSVIIMIMTVGGMAGAPLGGLVADAAGWRAVFLVKVPALVVALLVGALVLDRRRARGVPRPERGVWAEVALLGGAVAGLLLAFDAGAWWTSGLAAFAAAVLGALWFRLPAAAAVRDLVRRPTFGVTLTALFAVSLTAGVVAVLVPYFVSDVVRAPATVSGAALLFFVAGVTLGSPVGGWLADRFGPLRTTAAGGVATVAAMATLLTLGPESGLADLAWRMALFGLAGGLFNPAVNAATLAAAPPGAEGATGGVAMTVRTVAAAVGPAAAALTWTLAGGADAGFRAGVAVLLVAVVAGTAVVLAPALRRHPVPDRAPRPV